MTPSWRPVRCRNSSSDLGPLTGIYASSAKPDFRPLDRRVMSEAFALQPGASLLSEVLPHVL